MTEKIETRNGSNEKKDIKHGELGEKQVKTKHNLLDQGKFMSIDNNENAITKNIIIIGSKSSGKSSIFSLLSTRDPNSYSDNGTCGINYSFMRSKSDMNKKVLNIYEIGGDIENIPLITTILKNDNMENTLLFIVFDFERPQKALNSLLKYIATLRKLFNKYYDNEKVNNCIKNKIDNYFGNNRPMGIEPFPLDCYIICNKYDIIERIEVEKLKWTSYCLRYFAFANSMNLIFHSNKKKEYNDILYNTVTDYAFNISQKDGMSKYTEKNPTKALYIKFYKDSLEEIGEPKIPATVSGSLEERWKMTYDGIYKNYSSPVNEIDIKLDNENWNKYKENKIDHELKLYEESKNKNQENKIEDDGTLKSEHKHTGFRIKKEDLGTVKKMLGK